MTQLNLQLSTKDARGEIAALDARLDAFKAKLNSFGSAKGLETTLAKIASFKGIEAAAINSIRDLASTMQQAAQSVGQLSNLSKGLNALARVRVDSVAGNLERISKALASFKVPPNIDRLATALRNIAAVGPQAANGLRQVSAAANSIRLPPGLNAINNGLVRLNGSARSAGSGLLSLNGISNTVRNTLAGFGVVLGAFGFAQFISSTYDAVVAVDRFNNTIAATQGVNMVGKEMEFVRKTAAELKLSIRGLMDSYAQFSASASLSGAAIEDTHKIFTAVSTAARVLKLDQDRVRLSFLALSQMFNKGKVSMEELRRQLGEQIPGVFELSAQAMGVTTAKLSEMISKGNVAANDLLPKLADKLMETFGPQVPAALNTAQAAFDNFGNAIFNVSEAFGRGFFDAFKGSLDSLATTMNDPAFIEGARAWGKALGEAVSAAIQAVQWIAQHFDTLKNVVIGFLAINFAGTVYGWVQSLAAAGQLATLTAYNVGRLAFAFGSLSFVQYMFIGIRAAMTAAAAAGWSLMAAMGPLGIALAAIAFALPFIIAAFENWASVSAWLSDTNAQLTSGFYDLLNSMLEMIPLPPIVESGFMRMGRALLDLLKGISPVATALELLKKVWDFFFPPVQKAADASQKAAKAMSDAGKAAGSAVGPINGLGSAMGRAGNIAEGAAGQLREYAAAARAAAASGNTDLPVTGRRNKYGETIEEELSGYGYRTGGIAGKPTGKTYRLPASAWANAPSFAGGGLSDGGIPAVLHPNEAVVPLAGGGTIPVQMMSQGQGSLLLLKPLQQLVDFQKQTKTSVERVWEATTNQTVIMRNAFDRVEGLLLHIDNQRFPDAINAIASLKSAIGTGGGGFSGGGGSFGGTGAYSGSSVVDKIQAQLNRQLAEINAAATSTKPALGGPISGLTMINGKVVAHGSIAYYQEMAKVVQAQNDLILAEIAAGFYSDEELAKLLSRLESKRGLGFASGSPNASKDMNGGFTATLHPDEAVIPLPDGRSVPVQLPSSFMERVEQLVNEGDARVMNAVRNSGTSRSGGGNIVVQVQMTVTTKDAESFRASQDQMMRDLKTSIDRAVRNIGNRSDIDDPTRRV